MAQFDSVEAILEKAIEMEVRAAALYDQAAARAATALVRERLADLADQERGHKLKLEQIRAGNVRWALRRAAAEAVPDLRITDYLTGGSVDPDAEYQDVLLFAARREKTAHDFYVAMGERIEDPLVRDVFAMLAAEELRHKYLLEKTYEEIVYQDF
jgi:rubrerythrin